MLVSSEALIEGEGYKIIRSHTPQRCRQGRRVPLLFLSCLTLWADLHSNEQGKNKQCTGKAA
eukprot:1150961-Pelagomonas_calceolata.AAC.4